MANSPEEHVPMYADMLNRRCLPKYVGALQVREGTVWTPLLLGLICSKNFPLYGRTDSTTEFAHSSLLAAKLMRKDGLLD